MVDKREIAGTKNPQNPAAEARGAAVTKPGNLHAQHKAINQGLRAFFASVAAEPVSCELIDLLKRLDAQREGSGA